MLRRSLTFAILHSSFVIAANPAPIDYDQQVRPFLKDNCIACHNKTTTKGGLNMETPELMAKGGETDKGIVPGKGADSIMFQAAAHTWDSEMPPKGNKVGAVNLTTEQLALFKAWIDQGAKGSAKQEVIIAWQPLPPGLQSIYAVAVTPQGDFAAAARANQISLYHLPTQSLVTKLTDETLLKSGLYKQPGVAHRDVVQSLAFSPDGTRLATGSFREVKLWKRNTAAPAFAPSTKFTATQEADNSIKLTETAGAKLIALIKSDLVTEQTLAQRSLGAVRATLEVTYQNEAIKKADTDATEQTNRLKKANELADLAKKALEEKKKDIKPKEDAKIAAEKAAKEIGAQFAMASSGKPDEALAKKHTEAQAQAAKAASDLKLAQEALTRAETAITTVTNEIKLAASDAKKAADLTAIVELAKLALEDKKKAVKPKADAKAAADKVAKEIADQVAKVSTGKPDEALVKKNTDAQALATKAASDFKLAQEALTRAESAITDTANEIKLVTENEKKAKQNVVDAKARLEVVKKELEKATAERDLIAKTLTTGLKKAKALQFSANGLELVATFDAGPPLAWSTVNGKPIAPGSSTATWVLERSFGTGDGKSLITDRANSIAFSPDGKTLAIGSGEPSRSGDITLWDVATGTLTTTYAERHLDSIFALDFTPDGKLLASGGADKAVRITDLSTGKVVKVFEGHTHHVLGVSWRADGRLLASAGADNVVKIWDWTTGDRRKSVDGWDKEVTGIRYLGAADQIATSAGDTKLRLITSDGGQVKQLAGSTAFLQALATNQAGDLILGGDQDGTVRAWDVVSAKEIAVFKP
ncbi:MAG: c-type cytochrome domain-containing protein [Prosthecobacter sp.]|uniref:c-type cytochrome domain-containing protein n=1 Tax=Prosthecobacter sp. TaxID=1965333 RepID=UPI003902B6A8